MSVTLKMDTLRAAYEALIGNAVRLEAICKELTGNQHLQNRRSASRAAKRYRRAADEIQAQADVLQAKIDIQRTAV